MGADSEWKGFIEGPYGMMALVHSVLGEGTVRSYCSDHISEPSDMPLDPDIIYTTQGTGYLSDAAPRCLVYDPNLVYHVQPKFTWLYSHGPVFNRTYLRDVKAALQEMTADPSAYVIGMVFHVNDFLKSELNVDDPRYGRHIRELFAYLQAPQDGGGPVRIETLSGLMLAAGKTAAPDPCVETCFTQDERSESASYTVPVRVQNCP